MPTNRKEYMRNYQDEHRKELRTRQRDYVRRKVLDECGDLGVLCSDNGLYCLGCKDCYKQRIRRLRFIVKGLKKV